MKILSTLLIVLLCYSCQAWRSSEKHYDFVGRNLQEFPDSVLSKKRVVSLNFASRWSVIDPFGDNSSVGSNHIASLPDNIGRLKKLKYLNLSSNNLTVLPTAFHRLQSLEVLDLSFNEKLNIRQVVGELRQLKNLKQVNLFGSSTAEQDSAYIRSEIKAGVSVIATRHDWKMFVVSHRDSSFHN